MPLAPDRGLQDREGSPITNEPNTQIMMAAAEVMTRPVLANASATDTGNCPRSAPLLTHPTEQEVLVVHRER